MNRKGFLQSFFLGAAAVVATPLVGQLPKVGKMIPGMATLKPMLGQVNKLAASQVVGERIIFSGGTAPIRILTTLEPTENPDEMIYCKYQEAF